MDLRLEFLEDYTGHVQQLVRWHHEASAHLNPNMSVERRIQWLASRSGREGVATTVVALDDDTLLGRPAWLNTMCPAAKISRPG